MTPKEIRQMDIDAKNLRFYASLFRQYKWEPPAISWGVFEQTLLEIAIRYEELGHREENDPSAA